MSFDPSVYPAGERRRLILLGRGYASEDTLAQADKTLEGVRRYAGALAGDGFSAADGAELTAARDALLAAGVSREGAKGDRAVTSRAYEQALRDGRAARASARAILINSRRELARDNTEAGERARAEVDAALSRTRAGGEDPKALSEQLELLSLAFTSPLVAAAAASRGGAEASESLAGEAGALRAVVTPGSSPRGTPRETERLDLIDGVIIELVRGALKAAQAAATRRGEPALERAFELDKLYRSSRASRAAKKAAKPAPTGGSK